MLALLLKLTQTKKIKAKELAEYFEVSTRSIFRYIEKLTTLGIPIATETGPNGRIFLYESLDVKKIGFSNEEAEKAKSLLRDEKSLPNFNFKNKKNNKKQENF